MVSPDLDQLDQATSRRLARLAGLPVDTSRLAGRIRAQIPASAPRHRYMLKSLLGLAAALILIASIAIPLLSGPSQAQAMAQLHAQLLASSDTPLAHNLDEANDALAAIGTHMSAPPSSHTMACCMKSVQHKQVHCLVLKDSPDPVSITVAKACDMASPKSPVTVRDGVAYHVQTVGDLHMVMTQRGEQWICLISAAPAEQLIGVAARLRL